MPAADRAPASVIHLSRGGTVVFTSIGAVQFGAPPETIKDSLQAGIEVPSIYVMPQEWFSRRRGTTVAELEFPVYYNYFVLDRRVTAVCDEGGRRRLRAILRESLFGPETLDTSLDYAADVPPELRADLVRETEYFRRKGGKAGRHIQLDEVLHFALYEKDGRARLGGAVEVERRKGEKGHGWRLYDQGQLVAEVDDVEPAPHKDLVVPLVPQVFTPPAFGLTVLGSSHGFDPAGKTTGFVLWINRRGVLVDPPCDATETLRVAGVAPRQVDAVILTHCHADHDAGVFQKVLEEGRVKLYTTPTILCSFLRKYVALTGETEERLRRLFVYRPVTIGAPQRIHGGECRFFYSLHAIPTIGFECFFGGKSLVYSADTLYDPLRIEKMHEDGILSTQRKNALLHFPWHHSLVLHEAGVPPIHTPAACLAELSPEIKRRLRIIHIAEADLPTGQGLKLARTGFDDTLSLPVAEPQHAQALEALDALAGIELFRGFAVERCREFLTIVRREVHAAGTLVIGQGEVGDRFYIIVAGEAAVVKDGVVVKKYGDGDFFGETALVTGAPRSADVRAKTELVLLAIDKYDFLAFLRDSDLAHALVRLAQNRDLPSWALMSDNSVLGSLSSTQKTQLQALLEHRPLAAGSVLWNAGAPADAAWLLDDAEVEFHEHGHPVATLGRAALVGDIESLLRKRPVLSRAVVVHGGGAFRLGAEHVARFLEQNPGVLLALSGAQFVP